MTSQHNIHLTVRKLLTLSTFQIFRFADTTSAVQRPGKLIVSFTKHENYCAFCNDVGSLQPSTSSKNSQVITNT